MRLTRSTNTISLEVRLVLLFRLRKDPLNLLHLDVTGTSLRRIVMSFLFGLEELTFALLGNLNNLLVQFWQEAVEYTVDKNLSRIGQFHACLLNDCKYFRNLMNQQLERRQLEEALNFLNELILLVK